MSGGRLAQDNSKGIEAIDTLNFITYAQVPTDIKVTYASFVCDQRSLKDEKWRISLMVGGDKLI